MIQTMRIDFLHTLPVNFKYPVGELKILKGSVFFNVQPGNFTILFQFDIRNHFTVFKRNYPMCHFHHPWIMR